MGHVEITAALEATLWDLAGALADAARDCTLPLFRTGLAADNKAASGFDPVTEADRSAEAAMRALLEARRPEDAILGEEYGARPGSSGLTWVLDPVDGTRAFMSGAPTWGTLIGVDRSDTGTLGGPVLGVIDQAFTRERLIGGFGRALYSRDGQVARLRTRACARLEDAILYATRPEVGSDAEREGFYEVSPRTRLTRYGFDCYGFALVAMGHADMVIEAGLGAYDIQGPQAVIEAAGGVVTDWKGGPAHNGGRVIASGDPRLHEAALAYLSRVPDDPTA